MQIPSALKPLNRIRTRVSGLLPNTLKNSVASPTSDAELKPARMKLTEVAAAASSVLHPIAEGFKRGIESSWIPGIVKQSLRLKTTDP